MRRILLFAPVNLNIVDGSAIWLQSAAKLLSMMSGTEVHLLTHRCPLGALPEVDGPSQIIHPSDYRLTHSGLESLRSGMRITAANAAPAVKVLNQLYGYDYLVVRGVKEAIALSRDSRVRTIPYLTDVSPDILLQPDDHGLRAGLRSLLDAAPLILCQTPELQALFEQIAPAVAPKFAPLPPMLPDDIVPSGVGPTSHDSQARLVYAGKFSTGWGVLELMQLSRALQEEGALCDVHVFGDKIQVDSEELSGTIQEWFAHGPITYHRRTSRAALLDWLSQADIGFAYRSHELTASPEISTKLLEYIATDTIPLVNRNYLHEAYLGKDYPYFANTYDELVDAARRAIAASPAERINALRKGKAALTKHRFSAIAGELEALFSRVEPLTLRSEAGGQPQKLLLTGHDLKFMNQLTAKVMHRRNFEVDTETRPSFRYSDSELPRALREYDLVFCEWAVGNAVYYSHAKLNSQRLIVRFHRFEITTDLPQQIHFPAVDKMVFVSEHLRRDALAQYGWPEEQTCVIPNMIDTRSYDRQKAPQAHFNLGILGILPKLKRFDLAIDLLECLRQEDRRYQLHVKGKMPWDLGWVWLSPEQRDYFEFQMARIRTCPLLQGGVHFDPFSPDTPRWFENIGWILSPSDIESFHLAAMEGMASGATPVVIARSGASEIFPKDCVHADVDAMAEAILSKGGKPLDEGMVQDLKRWAAPYDTETVARQWAGLLMD